MREVLLPVYECMGLAWDPATVGALEDEIGPVAHAEVVEALLDELAKRQELARAPLPRELLAEAEAFQAEHRIVTSP